MNSRHPRWKIDETDGDSVVEPIDEGALSVTSTWRRTTAPPIDLAQPRIRHALPLRGVGRIPTEIDSDLCLVTYVDAAKTYDYRRIDADGNVVWHRSLPSGGYSSVVYQPRTGHVCGPTGYHAFAELDWRTGENIATVELGRRVRSSPLALAGSGEFVAAVGNRVHRFGAGTEPTHVEHPGQNFFGRPAGHGDLILTSGAFRAGQETATAVYGIERGSLESVWRTVVGDGFVPSADSSGVTLDGDHVYVTAQDGVVLALDATTGTIRWRSRLPRPEHVPLVHRCRPAVLPEVAGHAGGVIVTSLQGDVFMLSPDDGTVVWSSVPDRAAGIWSTALVRSCRDGEPEIVVHTGVLLVGLDTSTGTTRWALPIGFDAYTQPVATGDGLVLVCGGDPPDDGYLLAVSPDELLEQADRPAVTTEYRWGHGHDHLTVAVEASDADKVTADLRMFDRSGAEQFRADRTGRHVWRGTVSDRKRRADTAVFGQISLDGHGTTIPIYIDTGSRVQPADPVALAVNPENLPAEQENPVDSGGVVVASVLNGLGRSTTAAEVEQMADAIRDRGVDPHFVWRGGTERIFSAAGSALDAATVRPDDVIDGWERLDRP